MTTSYIKLKRIKMNLELSGKNAIITGATRGIGLAIATSLAEEGANIAICSRNAEDAQRVAKELAAKHGIKAIGGSVDLYDQESYLAWLKNSAEELGGIDIFVSNVTAGTALGADAWGAWEEYFNVDLMAAVRGFETVLPFLQASKAASAIFISSTAALEHFAPSPPGFMALKAALVTQAKTLAKHHGKDGIRINSVSPGPVYVDGGAWEYVKNEMTELYEQTLKDIPLGRMADADEIGKFTAFLASPAASYMNGGNYVLDGGLTSKIA
jgi:NAD(P)-dependent dehydrogenase (short-subunit alcohol dehydrogenase family)